MAFRGGAVQANLTASTTVVITVGGIGIQLGDVVLLFGSFNGEPDTISCPTFSGIAGLAAAQIGASNNTIAALSKIAGSSEPSTYTVTVNTSDLHTMQCRVYSGRNGTVTAKQVTNLAGSGSQPITLTITGLTAAAGDDVVCLAAGTASSASDTYGWTPPSGYGNSLVGTDTTSFAPACYGADKLNVSAGATGTLSATLSDTASNNIGAAVFLLSLAAGSGGTRKSSMPLTGVGAIAPLAWVIRRRQIRAKERNAELRQWNRDDTSGLILPSYKKAS